MMRLILLILLISAVGCGSDHPAYELDLEASSLEVAQSGGEPDALARLVVRVSVTPGPDHVESVVRLGSTARFESGVLRLYEPEPGYFVYDERKPLLAVPASLVSGGRRLLEGTTVTDEPLDLEVHGQVSNLELESLCGQTVVAVPRLVVAEPGATEEDQLRDARLTAVGEVVCR